MGKLGQGYGSECHLLRWMGRHRQGFDRAMRTATGASQVDWLDAPFDATRPRPDGEWKGLDFLPPDSPSAVAWRGAWPQRGNTLNWDAVGRGEINGAPCWLLLEAKAHTGEVRSSCGASERGGLPLIRATMARTKAALDVPENCDWLNGHYQLCNRLTALHHLLEHGEAARLVFLYFTGDRFKDGTADCPAEEGGWASTLKAMDDAAGVPADAPIRRLMHKVFLPVVEVPAAGKAIEFGRQS